MLINTITNVRRREKDFILWVFKIILKKFEFVNLIFIMFVTNLS